MDDKSNGFYGALYGSGEKPKSAAIAQDQDTVIGDAMCHASQIIYDCATYIAACINENNQAAIDIGEIQKAEKAFCYMEGVEFGLAMDDKAMLWYMTELARCMASIEMSRENGFQTQVYLPPVKPCDLFGYDEVHCRNNPVTFLRIDLKKCPTKEYVEMRKKELAKDKNFKYLFEKGILDPLRFPGAPAMKLMEEDPDADDAEVVIMDEGVERKNPKSMKARALKMGKDSANVKAEVSQIIRDVLESGGYPIENFSVTYEKDNRWAIGFGITFAKADERANVLARIKGELDHKGIAVEESRIIDDKLALVIVDAGNLVSKTVGDDNPSITRLRNLYRDGKINKGQLIGGAATLLAAGMIDKATFTRIQLSA